ncbi:RIP metalloprotease RseP [Flavobacterium aciduliphilum]|uniref:Zinc metalloprotease n=1 Tax=Flavobacterium aciduliphilum TaxID=1101402 RepID=A0A328YFM5_9FLAO|nr:RIP metalloprotease RseP [Flavobacterium aciduliphilum]RAR72811.1 regulator of sigma E protease [Flavobacterium aciduliphilum]
MEFAIKLAQFLLSLSILIILHELGHFIPSKLFKTKVEKFYLFFDIKFSLFKKKIGETEYGIGWLPLGGYVKIAGMIDESMDTEQMKGEPQPWEFRSKPAWQRLIIMLGGVIVNFILAFIIYIGISYVFGDYYIENKDVKDGIEVNNIELEKAGLKTGDKLISIDDKKITTFVPAINMDILTSKKVVVDRNGEPKTIFLPNNFIGKFIDADKKSLISLRMPFVIGGFASDSPNKNNLKTKDIVLSLNGQKIKYFDEASSILETNKSKTIPAIVLRNDKETPVQVTVTNKGKLGVIAGALKEDNLEKLGYYKFSKVHYGFFEAVPIGLDKGVTQLGNYWKQLKLIFNPSTGAYKGVGGFGAIFNVFPASWSWFDFWNITALLSIMLGVMNLLPIPALDGGHVLFLIYEMISGKKPSDKFLEKAQTIGIVLLISLLLFANGNDIYKALFGK